MKKIPYENLVEDLKRVKELIGKIPTQDNYKKFGKYSPDTYKNKKKWKEWINEVFNITYKIVSYRKISRFDLIQNLLEMQTKLKRVPKKEDLRLPKSKYSMNAYKREFGNLANALLAAGLKPHQIRGLSNEELLDDVKRVYKILGHTPSLKEFTKYSSTVSWGAIYDRFGSWTKVLIAAGIPVLHLKNISKDFIKKELQKWYEKHDCDVDSLTYWSIRKGKENSNFPICTVTIKEKFDGKPWEEIMHECGFTDYESKDQFKAREVSNGKDGNRYLSKIEKEAGNILFDLKDTKQITDYEYEAKICDHREWTCDFKIITKNNNVIWLEVDGMRSNRKNPYKSGNNEKINYYIDNGFNYKILSYNHRSVPNFIKNAIKEQ